MPKVLRALVLGLLLGVAGCAGLSGLKAPEVAVSEVTLGRLSLTEQRLKLRLRVSNPNERELALNGLVFQVDTGELTLARGVSNQAVVVPALGEGFVDVEVGLQTQEFLNLLPRLNATDGQFEYRLKGEAVTRDYGRIPVSRSGHMALPLGKLK